MYPPSWACEAIYRIHPQLRVGWAGRPRRNSDELNAGDFALVQLYHISDVGPMSDPITYRETWDVTTVADEYGRTERVKVDRGPIYDKHGVSRRDWDPLFRIPIFVCTLNEAFEIDRKNSDGVWEQTIEKIRIWLSPIYDRIRAGEIAKGKRMNAQTEELADVFTDHLWKDANTNDTGRLVMDRATIAEQTNFERLEKKAQIDFASEELSTLPSPKAKNAR